MPALASLGKDALREAEVAISEKQGRKADLFFIITLKHLQVPYLCISLVTAWPGS